MSRRLSFEYSRATLKGPLPDAKAIAAGLRNACEQAVEAILAKRQSLDVHQPLIVLLGESHLHSSEVVFQQMLIEALYKKTAEKKLGVGFEIPHNLASRILASTYSLNKESIHRLRISSRDPLFELRVLASYLETDYGRMARRNFLFYLLQRKIPTRFHDAARLVGKYRDLIDFNDTRTMFLTRSFLRKGGIIPAASYRGMVIRNAFMAELIDAAIKKDEASIYVHICGDAHLVGNTKTPYEYEDSLSKELIKRGYAVMPITSDIIPEMMTTLQTAPPEAHEVIHDLLIVTGLPEGKFCYKHPHDDSADEFVFLNRAKSGLGPDYSFFHPDKTYKATYQTRRYIEALIAKLD